MAKASAGVKRLSTSFFINVDFLIENAVFANEFRRPRVVRFAPMNFAALTCERIAFI